MSPTHDGLVGRVHASRVPAARRILKALRALIVRNARVRLTRCRTDEEYRWTARVHDLLVELVDVGERTLPAHYDPRDHRRVRKSKPVRPMPAQRPPCSPGSLR